MRNLIILFLIYLLFQVVFRFVLPLLARYMMQKAARGMQAQFGTQRPKSQAPPRREGEVRIEHPDNRSRRNYDDEEYTSYTEVK
ncbi:MAG: hypothetical protein ACK5B6_01465 [Bacteroidia bacterium]|jgi:hypothetical protein